MTKVFAKRWINSTSNKKSFFLFHFCYHHANEYSIVEFKSFSMLCCAEIKKFYREFKWNMIMRMYKSGGFQFPRRNLITRKSQKKWAGRARKFCSVYVYLSSILLQIWRKSVFSDKTFGKIYIMFSPTDKNMRKFN